MRFNYKIFGLLIFVMLICCVSAASAADVDNMTVPDDADVIEIDDSVDSVDDVEQDDVSSDNPVTPTRGTVTDTNYWNYFNTTSGNLLSDEDLTFSGTFTSKSFGNFKIDRSINLNVAGATFNDIGFDLLASGLTLNGATFVIDAPNGANCYAIDVENANNAKILNNQITYTCDYTNAANYNYVIKVMNSENVEIDNNTITASLPLKDIDWSPYPSGFPGISYDKVAGVAVENAKDFKFTNNVLNVTGHLRDGYAPTLDALLVVKSNNTVIDGNKIYENDNVTASEQTNYLYAVDIYQCNAIKIKNNVIELNSGSGNLTVNGTGGAYGIQLSGPHTGVEIFKNNITTANNGPNLGIYSQSAADTISNIQIKDNNIEVTGRSGDNPWALVSGIEVQDAQAVITGNHVKVHDVDDFVEGNYLFGISYAQYIGGNHTLTIENNTVETDGDYAVHILYGINCNVCDNHLVAEYIGNFSVQIIDGIGNTVVRNW